MLNYNPEFDDEWKYAPLPAEADRAFRSIIEGICRRSRNSWDVYETFKSSFGWTGGSTSESWAASDMFTALSSSQSNPAIYVVSFCNALEELSSKGVAVPGHEKINAILKQNEVPLEIVNKELILRLPDLELEDTVEIDAENESSGGRFTFNKETDLIGAGGFGSVYRASRRTSVGTFVHAVKIFDPSPFQPNLKRCLARFKREVTVLSSLQHRGIVKLIEAGLLADRTPYLLMALIDGTRFDESCEPLDYVGRLRAFAEVAGAVGYAHGQGVLHRDLKPSNILVQRSDSQPIILDFGCAFVLDGIEETELTTTIIGSQKYIPPEVLADPKLRTSEQDVFALGVMLYEVFSDVPFNLQSLKSLRSIDQSLESVDRVVAHATAQARSRAKDGIALQAAIIECIASL
jgi:hypothetical protein